MKDKGWFSRNIYKNRRIYMAVFAMYTLIILGIFIYYSNMRERTYVVKGTIEGGGTGELSISAERSKEWRETGTPGFYRLSHVKPGFVLLR